MNLSRCSAGSAYDAKSALRSTFHSLLDQYTPIASHYTTRGSRRHAQRPHNAVTTTQRSYSKARTAGITLKTLKPPFASAEDLLQEDLQRIEDLKRRRVGMYQGVLDGSEFGKDGEFIGMVEKTRGGATHNRDPVLGDWKAHMLHLSAYIRDNRDAPFERRDVWSRSGLPDAQPPSLDYTGFNIPLEDSGADPPRPVPWEQSPQKREELSASELLDLEIEKFAEHMASKKQESLARQKVFSLMRDLMRKNVYKSHEFYIQSYGSTTTGLAMPSSDVDIGVGFSRDSGSQQQTVDVEPQAPNDSIHFYDPEYSKQKNNTHPGVPNRLEDFYKDLKWRGSQKFSRVVYRGAPVPIVTAVHTKSGIAVQVLEKKKPGGQDACVKEHINNYPNLAQLFPVIRTMLNMRGLLNPFGGGISSYGAFMMLAASLRHKNKHQSPQQPLSAQLLHFLDFWATFNTARFGIDVGRNKDPARSFKKSSFELVKDLPNFVNNGHVDQALSKGDFTRAGQHRIGVTKPRQPYLMCLQDPANPWNDLGRGCHAIKHIQATCRSLRNDLQSAMREHDLKREPAKHANPFGFSAADYMPKREASLLLPLVGRCHEVYAERRKRMSWFNFGNKVRPVHT